MSFGFSIGDFIAVGSLIADIISSLREAGGSKSEYQELLSELENLQHALNQLDKLQLRGSKSTNLDSIKHAALSCKRPLEDFLRKVQKFDKSLGVWSERNRLQSTKDKLRWACSHKDEIRKLQSYLNIHVGTINILLAEYGLEMLDAASDKTGKDQMYMRESLDDAQKVIRSMKTSVSAQATTLEIANSMLSNLFQMVNGEIITSLKSLGEMVVRVCVSTQQTYDMVLEIRNSLYPVDTRWTFFQAPLMVEDALGFKFPVPSEYDYELLSTIIKHRFLDGPGSNEVNAGNYELFSTRDSKKVVSPGSRLLPGTSITMAIQILVSALDLNSEECPMPRCRSIRTSAAPGGGRLCCECNVWFDKSNKKRNDLIIDQQYRASTADKQESDQNDMLQKGVGTPNSEESIDSFKNVRWSVELHKVALEVTSHAPNAHLSGEDSRSIPEQSIQREYKGNTDEDKSDKSEPSHDRENKYNEAEPPIVDGSLRHRRRGPRYVTVFNSRNSGYEYGDAYLIPSSHQGENEVQPIIDKPRGPPTPITIHHSKSEENVRNGRPLESKLILNEETEVQMIVNGNERQSRGRKRRQWPLIYIGSALS